MLGWNAIGDVYAGGNPWILSTAAFAEHYYLIAISSLKTQTPPPLETLRIHRRLFNLEEGTTYLDVVNASIQTGDYILWQLKYDEFLFFFIV
mgnify:CR=1 FL=1